MPTPESIQRVEIGESSRSLSRQWGEMTEQIDRMADGSARIEIPRNVLETLSGRTISLLRHQNRESHRRRGIPDSVRMFSFGDVAVEDEALKGRVTVYPFFWKLAPQVEFSAANDPRKLEELMFRVEGVGIAKPAVGIVKKIAEIEDVTDLVFFKEGVMKMLVGDALGVDISSWRLDRGRLVIEGVKVPTSELYRRVHAPFSAMIKRIKGEKVVEEESRPRIRNERVLGYLDVEDFHGNEFYGREARERDVAFDHYDCIGEVLTRRMRQRLEQVLGVTSAQLQSDRRLAENLTRITGYSSWKSWLDSTARSLSGDEAQMVIHIGFGESNYDNSYSPRSEFRDYRWIVEGTRFDKEVSADNFVEALCYGRPDEFDFDLVEPLVGLERLNLGESFFGRPWK